MFIIYPSVQPLLLEVLFVHEKLVSPPDDDVKPDGYGCLEVEDHGQAERPHWTQQVLKQTSL